MDGPNAWDTTTHVWAGAVDHAHLTEVRARLGRASGGRRHLVLEILAYAADEAQARDRTGHVTVVHHPDGHISVRDDGRGTDTRTTGSGRVIRKPVMATPDVRFRDPLRAPLLPDGLPRSGMSAVSALSSELVHENHRVDGCWTQTYRYGVPEGDLVALPGCKATGTVISFRTDVGGPLRLTTDDIRTFPGLRIECHPAMPDAGDT